MEFCWFVSRAARLPVRGVHLCCWERHSRKAAHWQHAGPSDGSLWSVWWFLGHLGGFFKILLCWDKIYPTKAFIQTSANGSYSWPIDTLLLLGGGWISELILCSCGLLLIGAGLLFHPWPCPDVIRIVLPVLGQEIVQGVSDQPLEALVSQQISSMYCSD